MPLLRYYRDWESYPVELRADKRYVPQRRRFYHIIDELRALFRERAATQPKVKGKSRRGLADEEFFEWYGPVFHQVTTDTEWRNLFFPPLREDRRELAVTELDSWYHHVLERPDEYPSPKSLPRLTDTKNFPVIATALELLASRGQGAATGGQHHTQAEHSLAASHRRLSHRQQAIYSISQREFARAGF